MNNDRTGGAKQSGGRAGGPAGGETIQSQPRLGISKGVVKLVKELVNRYSFQISINVTANIFCGNFPSLDRAARLEFEMIVCCLIWYRLRIREEKILAASGKSN